MNTIAKQESALKYLVAATLCAGFGLGYVKFFLLGVLSSDYYTLSDKPWVIQAVGAIITLGPALVFLLAAPLASAFPKRQVMTWAAGFAAAAFSVGVLTNWAGTPWLYVFAVGLLIGVFSPAKNAAIPIEAKLSGRSTESVNAYINIALILGLLAGVPVATGLYEYYPELGSIVGILVFGCCAWSGYRCRYSSESSHLVPFGAAQRTLQADTAALFKRQRLTLLVTPLIWGIASAVSLAVTAYAEVRQLGTPLQCSLMSVYAVLGVAAGNLFGNRLQAVRYQAAVVGSVVMSLLIFGTPVVVEFMNPVATIAENVGIYWVLAALTLALGAAFGVATNLIESRYLNAVYAEGKEGTGAALLSAGTAAASFILGGAIGVAVLKSWIDPFTQFVAIGVLGLITTVLVWRLGRQAGASWRDLAAMLLRSALRSRYRVEIKGLEKLSKQGGLIVAPNHPAEVDPLILISNLWPTLPLRPLMLERYYQVKAFQPLLKAIGAIPVPDMDQKAGAHKRRRVAKALAAGTAALQTGENILIYPSGRIMRSGLERLGANSGLASLMAAAPESRLALVRIRGLYGSTFSAPANGGDSPDFFAAVKGGLWTIVKNFVFFAPKRSVQIEIELMPAGFFRNSDVVTLNEWIEDWYNRPGAELPTPVSRSRWTYDVPEMVENSGSAKLNVDDVPKHVQESVRQRLAEVADQAADGIEPGHRLAEDLALDSLTVAELIVWLDEEFDASEVEYQDLKTVGAVMRAAAGGLPEQVEPGENAQTPAGWELSSGTVRPECGVGETVLEAFFNTCKTRGSEPAAADTQRGVVTYRELKRNVLALSKPIADLPGDRVGILLPASTTALTTLLAVQAAGKIPVMINWTTGKRNIEHALEIAEVKQVVTAGAFLDALDTDLEFMEERLNLLEDLKEHINLRMKLSVLVETRRGTRAILRRRGLQKITSNDPAVILFTSGSESVPKGVPLSHVNILSNVRGALETIELNDRDVFFGFLPPFHSFGFTITSLLPVLCGLRVVFHPNPNESRKLAKGCARWQVSVMAGTPTFLQRILKAGESEQFRFLRYLVTGAERAPEQLFSEGAVVSENLQVLEGYGITECSPVISVNRPKQIGPGVGEPLPGVEVLIVGAEDFVPRAEGESGLILVRGPGVFSGYLGSVKSPFVDVAGRTWYNTGDLGRLIEGRIVIDGRLKRFVKIAGEMISLPAIETALQEELGGFSEDPNLAVIARANDDERPEFVLFTTETVDLEWCNTALRRAGFSNLVKIAAVFEMNELPLLGTGKVDYRTLNENARKGAGSLSAAA